MLQYVELLLHSHHDTSVLIPGKHSILTTPHLRIPYVRPTPEEVFVCHDPRQSTSYRPVNIFHHAEVGREQDVEVALKHHRRADRDCPALISCLYDWRVVAWCGLSEGVEVGCHQSVCWEVVVEDVEELH